MLRGVNKKIIEVIDTQNEYFERAILFVKNGKIEENEGDIKKNADTFLKDVGTRRLRRIISHAPLVEGLKLLCAAGIGAALTLAVVLL
ncbi:MAG: hypothetical protein RSB36_01045 [Hydrogenoanaerobacterium sp.]